MTYHTGATPEPTHHAQQAAGTAGPSDGYGSEAVGAEVGDVGMVVDWDVPMRRRLEAVGLAGSVPSVADVDAVVVDRRGSETTPCEPGVLPLDGRRVLVVPDRRDGAPAIEVWVSGTADRFEGLVRTLRLTVTLDESVEDAFASASQSPRADPWGRVPTDGDRPASPVESLLERFEGLDETGTALAIGGFAAAVEPLEPSG